MLPSRLQLPPGPWHSLLDGLCARFPRIDRETWASRFARGLVQDASGAPLDAHTPYRVGLEIRYFREVSHEPAIPFEERVLHVDTHLVVADKPHFLPVVPAGAYVRETLLARLVHRLDNKALAPLHRIDRETAGLVLFSADASTRAAYQALFRTHAIRKRYEALAPPLPALAFPHTYRSCLVPGEPFFRMREGDGAPNSETRIDVIERGDTRWHYALEPVTGRKHQLRVHMAALGAPILGDRLYPHTLQDAGDVDGRQDFEHPLALLAKSLEFVDPCTGERRFFESPRTL